MIFLNKLFSFPLISELTEGPAAQPEAQEGIG